MLTSPMWLPRICPNKRQMYTEGMRSETIPIYQKQSTETQSIDNKMKATTTKNVPKICSKTTNFQSPLSVCLKRRAFCEKIGKVNFQV